MAAPRPGSVVLLEELLEREDPRFFAEIVGWREPGESITHRSGAYTWTTPKREGPFARTRIGAFGEKWARDARPFARVMLLRWIHETAGAAPGQRPLVKQVLKTAEAQGDAEVLAAFLVAFDRLVRFRLKRVRRWDWLSQTSNEITRLERVAIAGADPLRAPVFSVRTRAYLRRRVLRFFRAMGARDAAEYRRWVFGALARYEDEHLAKPEDLLASWSLMRLVHEGCDALVIDPRSVRIAAGRRLADLRPAPMHAEAWRDLDALLALLATARSLYVRRQVALFLEQEMPGALDRLRLAKLRPLLSSPHPDVAELASRHLERARGLESLSIAEWDELLAIEHPPLLSALAAAMRAHVSPARVPLDQCARWARASAAPIAELGLAWARTKSVSDAASLELALPILHAPVATIRADALEWLMPLVIGLGAPHHLRDLLDSRFADVRERALAVLAQSTRFRDQPELWAALAETPYPDTRERLVAHLTQRASALPPASLHHVWATTLLAVERGSRAKRQTLSQIAERIAAHPDDTEQLLPLLALTLRSVREPERRAAIAALVRAAARSPALLDRVRAHVPGLEIAAIPEAAE